VSYAIQAEGLTKRYGKTIALSELDLAARPGSVLGLLGPGGAGKTTAVRILATLLRPDAGHATVGGYDVLRQPDRVRGLIGVTGQFFGRDAKVGGGIPAVDETLTGFEHLQTIGQLAKLSRGDAKRRAHELLDRFGLSAAGGRPVTTYSKDLRRRLDLAASVVSRPQVLLLDELTAGLDPGSRAEMWRLVRGLAADGVTVLLTTPHLDEADQLATDIAVIDRGLLIASGTPSQLKAKVGGQTLDVRPADPIDLAAVRAVVSSVTGVAPRADADPGLVSVPVDDPGALAEVMSWLQEAGISVTRIGLRLASLDEVFLALTGRRTVEPGAAAA
jgi:oleandomycin transport system ATP-binding protein